MDQQTNYAVPLCNAHDWNITQNFEFSSELYHLSHVRPTLPSRASIHNHSNSLFVHIFLSYNSGLTSWKKVKRLGCKFSVCPPPAAPVQILELIYNTRAMPIPGHFTYRTWRGSIVDGSERNRLVVTILHFKEQEIRVDSLRERCKPCVSSFNVINFKMFRINLLYTTVSVVVYIVQSSQYCSCSLV